MVEFQLRERGISDERVLRAFEEVKREDFIPDNFKDIAYADNPLPIGEDQTISQPYIVALMTQALRLKDNDTVLEIGTGSGYQAAILSKLCKRVVSVERFGNLARDAERALRKNNISNVKVIIGDGTLGYESDAPYDAIIVTAACFKIPDRLMDQLAEGGRLVIPLGNKNEQELVKITKLDGEVLRENLGGCRFVPLVGKDGWD